MPKQINQIYYQAIYKSIPYQSNMLPIKKSEPLRVDFLSKLDNTVTNNFILNTKCAEFSTKSQVLFQFRNLTCKYNHPCNLHQKSVPPLQLIFTALFSPYLFIKLSLESPLTLPSSIPQQFFTSLFLRTAIPKIYIKSISLFTRFRLRRGANEKGSRVRTDTVLISLFPQNIDRDNRAHNH